MIKQEFSNLTGKVLIATPFKMKDNVFYKSLIYVVKHAKEGSVGLILNHPVNNPPANVIFKEMSKSNNNHFNFDVHLGGPVDLERGFFLHTGDYDENLLFEPSGNNLAISSNDKILQDITDGVGPQKNLFIIGYTGWEANQLELELQNNLWLITEPDHDLIFLKDHSKKWGRALSKIGITETDFITAALGNC